MRIVDNPSRSSESIYASRITVGPVVGGLTAAGHLTSRRGAVVRRRQRYLSVVLALTFTPVGVIAASPASADCVNSGNATVCAQGTVRGGGQAPSAGPSYPSYCADPWYCDD